MILPRVEILSAARARVSVSGRSLVVSRLLGDGDTNTKLAKGADSGYRTWGLSLLPHRLGGIGNVCPHASRGCIRACLNETGLASVFPAITFARLCRRMLWHLEREWFLERLHTQLARKAQAGPCAVRLNVFSDIPWERFGVPQAHPDVWFYDYTKAPGRAGLVCPNYWVTLSRSERNDQSVLQALRRRQNAAVVFYQPGPYAGNRAGLQVLPRSWRGFDVIDGDRTDLRFTDPRGRSRGGKVVGLRLKAPTNAKREAAIASGFALGAGQ